MALKNRFYLLIVVPFVTLTALEAAAQRNKDTPLWSVQSSVKGEVVPPYTGLSSPFPEPVREETQPVSVPIVKPVEEPERRRIVVTEKKPEIRKRSFQDVLVEERTRKAGLLLQEIRRIIFDKEAFLPDLSVVRFDGMIKGQQRNERRVLYRNQWIEEGEPIAVKPLLNDKLYKLVADLETVDAGLARQVEEDLIEQMRGDGPILLTLHIIGEENLVLKDTLGSEYKVALFDVRQ